MNQASQKLVRLFLLVLVALPAFQISEAGHYRFWLHGKIRFPYSVATGDTTGGSDCWGWTAPDGTEYAIMGVRDGIAVVNAHTMQIKGIVPGPQTPASYYWRDVETYGHYAYAVSELTGTNQGLSVIDLQYLPDSLHFVGSFSPNGGTAITAHTISIDTIKGFAYCEGSGTAGQPVRILSLANPEAPTFVGSFDILNGQQVHDMHARNDTVFVAEGYSFSWSVWNCANKASPSLITRVNFPNAGYMHSTVPTEDRNWLLTTEEVPSGKTMKLWDIGDLGNIDMRGQYIGASQRPHNVYPKGNLVFVSHYEAGVTVVDISNPDTLVEVARYDTYPASDDSLYRGCWSAYPYTGNGFVYASNLDGWLFVLGFGQMLAPLAPQTMLGGDTLSYHLVTTGPDSLGMTLSATGLKPHIALVDSGNGRGSLTFTPSRFYSGTDTVTVFAADSAGTDSTLALVTIQGQAKGDFNFDLMLSPADAVLGLNCIFLGLGDCPLEVADVNCDLSLTPADAVLLLNAVFLDTPFPC